MDQFIDDIGLIRIGGGLVRIQTVRRMQDEKGEQRAQERGDLVLPIASFLRMHTGINRAIDEMLEKGILKRREDEKIEGEGDASDVIDTQVGK
jgi:hypothetical protein